MTRIMIAEDFSRSPGGRFHPKDGHFTGQRFRAEFLIPALRNSSDKIMIYLDGVRGYPSSFLDEAFGGLIHEGFASDVLHRRIEFVYSDKSHAEYEKEIWEAVDIAQKVVSH